MDMEGGDFRAGYLISFGLHLFGALYLLFGDAGRSSASLGPTEVYTVTLEGGDRIGGISQVPLEEKKTKVLPNTQEPLPQDPNREAKQAPPQNPAAIEEAKKAQEEKKKLEEKKKIEEEKKKLEEEFQKKKQEDLEKKKKEQAEKEKEKKARDKKLLEAISKAANYKGESANAGGEGLGAARLGKGGMGGGTLASAEFILYRNALEQHIKGGWRWLPSPERYVCQVEFSILPDGTVQNASLVTNSGNSSFDESALRAVYKSSPVPIPPESLYSQFRVVRITFDSEK